MGIRLFYQPSVAIPMPLNSPVECPQSYGPPWLVVVLLGTSSAILLLMLHCFGTGSYLCISYQTKSGKTVYQYNFLWRKIKNCVGFG
jgi:hypothetical protein